MKKRKTTSAYTSFSLLFIVALLSFSSNPPNARTGAPGEGNCSGCHNSPPAGATGLVSIEDLPATIMPNTTYTLTVRSEATSGSPSTGGFQLVALDDSDINVGDLISISGNTGTNTAGSGREYMESRGDKNITGTDVAWTFNWVSPTTGSGNINMWASSVLANNNGSTSGDLVVLTSISAPFMGGGTPPTATVSTIDAECAGTSTGFATANATGGTPPYSYSWSNGGTGPTISTLPANTYFVTVTDANNLTTTASGTVGEPSPISISINTMDPTCNGLCNGTIQSFVNGGTGNYSYMWSPTGQTTATITGVCAGIYTLIVTDANDCTASIQSNVIDPPPILLSFSTVDASCNGACNGSASVLPTGGNPPFTYQWGTTANNQTNPTAINLCAGIHEVVVTDLIGCTKTESISINEPNIITVSTSSTEATCGLCNGTATVNPSSGIHPFTFLWDINTGSQLTATATALCIGTYSVTISDGNNCEAIEFVSVSGPNPLVLTSTTVAVNCNGDCDGSATTTATGGTPPYTVIWDANTNNQTNFTAVNLCAGTYTVTVTDSDGCLKTDMVTINEPPAIVLSITQNAASCNGLCDGFIDLTVTGGSAPFAFTWDNVLPPVEDQSGLCPGVYSVTVNDVNGCSAVTSVTISEPSPINVDFNIVCETTPGANDGSLEAMASGGTPGYSYLWENMATTTQISNLAPGVYSLTVTDDNGCTEFFSATVCSAACGLALTLSPIDVSCNGDSTGIAIATVGGGTPPYQFNWSNGANTNPATGLPAGLYSLTVVDAADCSIVGTLVVSEPNPLSADINQVNGISCNGNEDGVATVIPGGGNGGPYSILWSNGGTNSTQNNLAATGMVRITDDLGCSEIFPYTLSEPEPLVVDLSSTPETMLGTMDGTATATPQGGTLPYLYLWNTGGTDATIIDLAPGTYSVTVTDNAGCTISNMVEVNAGGCDLVLNSLTTIDISCTANGLGSATIDVSGGTLPYTYMWSSGGNASTETGLDAGNYTVSVLDANNCIISRQFTINIVDPINFEILSQTKVDCGGDPTATATVEATGGSMPYTYAWSNGGTMATETGLTNTTYVVIVADANLCMDTVFITIEAEDITPPLIDPTPPNINVYLDTQGEFVLVENDLDAGASDNCGMVDIFIDRDTFDCSMVGNIQTIVYTATDQSGNTATATFEVSVLDTLPPEVIAQDIDLYLGNTGVEFIDFNDIIVSASDNCMLDSFILDRDGFGCPDLGMQTVHFLIFDVNGNRVEDSVVVTVLDTLSPIIICPGDFTTTSCDGVVDYMIDFTDNCLVGPPALISGLPSGAVFPFGQTLVSYEILDMGGNVATCSFTLTVDSLPDLEANLLILKTPCPGEMDGSIEAIPTGGQAPYSFLWDDPMMQTTATATNLAPGTYTVEITDNLACDTISRTIQLDASPKLVIDVATVGAANNGMSDGSIDVNVSGGTSPYNFLWSNGATTEDLSAIPSGIYILEVTDDNACVFTSDSIVVDNKTGTINLLPEQSVSLFPNPNNGHFVIYLEGAAMGQEWQIDLFDLQGRSVRTSEVNRIDRQLEIQTTDLADGVYLFRLQNALGVVVKKLLISRE